MKRIAALACLLLIASLGPARASDDVTVMPMTFTVTNPLDPGATYTVAAKLFTPDAACRSSVLLLVHGLSYGMFGWDFPVEPETYSTARALAARGYPNVIFDLPGYGESTHPASGGRVLTVESYADMVSQMVNYLRRIERYKHVGLLGHSAGTEISELAAAVYHSADVLIATSYSHFPSQRVLTDFISGDYVRATTSDYEYFGGDVNGRTEYMYNTANADAAVIARDNELARLTPAGEIYSIGPQPSGKLMETITVPVLGVFAQNDLLFPIDYSAEEMLLFAGAQDKQMIVAANDGHSFMLHRNAPDTFKAIADWLDARPGSMGRCS